MLPRAPHQAGHPYEPQEGHREGHAPGRAEKVAASLQRLPFRHAGVMPSAPDPPKPEMLRGLVERVTFHTEETGYSILKVLPDKKRDLVTLIGRAPRVVAGERFEVEGRWETDRTFGPQFRADVLRLAPPDSEEGMELYLGSGLIEGIGPAYAKRLLERFGPKV